MHKIVASKKLMEMATPIIDKMVDKDVSEKELDVAMKITALAHYLYEIELMEEKLCEREDETLMMANQKKVH